MTAAVLAVLAVLAVGCGGAVDVPVPAGCRMRPDLDAYCWDNGYDRGMTCGDPPAPTRAIQADQYCRIDR